MSFRGGRVAAIFTHWSPPGWRTMGGIRIGDPVARVVKRHGALPRTPCSTYSVLTLRRRGVVTSFYVVDERVWGFGLATTRMGVCR
ncbi:MAG: hypothetical protein ABR583_12980 [Gaiellaceae bacterium]